MKTESQEHVEEAVNGNSCRRKWSQLSRLQSTEISFYRVLSTTWAVGSSRRLPLTSKGISNTTRGSLTTLLHR